MIGHLRSGCVAVAPFFDEPNAGAWAADVRGLLDGIATEVVGLGDAAMRHDEAAVTAGWARYQTVLLDHFWQSIKGDPEAYRIQLRDGGGSATASHVRWTNTVEKAFDGDARSFWLAGDVPAPQWIEVDLGREATLTGIRLLTWQETAGPTDHQVTVRSGTGVRQELARFTDETTDGQWLRYTVPTPQERVRYVRITTLTTPSMIGWREIEVAIAEGSTPGPCPAATTLTTPVARTTADPSTGASDPALAVDGNEATGCI